MAFLASRSGDTQSPKGKSGCEGEFLLPVQKYFEMNALIGSSHPNKYPIQVNKAAKKNDNSNDDIPCLY
jgi:hypothetical protein